MAKFLWVFGLFLGCFSSPFFEALADYPEVVIQDILPASFEGPAHHGIVIETGGIADPNLTAYEVHIKPDGTGPFPPWNIYSTKLYPLDSNRIDLPYRNGYAILKKDQKYCVRLRPIYANTPGLWVEKCGLTLVVSDAPQVDNDGDGLKDADEYALGTDPHSVDTDGDGVDDSSEADANTDPTHAVKPRIILRTASLDFEKGNPLGTYPSQHQFIEIENVGDDTAKISSINIVSTNAGEGDSFKLGAYPQSLTHIAPQSKIRVPISFFPTRRGLITAQLEIDSDNSDPIEPIQIQGMGVDIPDCQVSPATLDFGQVSVKDLGVSVQEVTLSNIPGPGPDPYPNENGPWAFTLATNDLEMAPGIRGYTLQKGEEIKIPVLFQHLTPGDHSSVLFIRSAVCGTQQVQLRAIGLE